MATATATTTEQSDWKEVSDKLQNLLRLRTLPIGMKLFETVEERVARSPAPITSKSSKTRLTRAYYRRSRPLRLRASGRPRLATAPSSRRPARGALRCSGDRLKSHLTARHYRGAANLRKHSAPQG